MKGQNAVLLILLTLTPLISVAHDQGNLTVSEGTVFTISDGTTFTLADASLVNDGMIEADKSNIYIFSDNKNTTIEGNPLELYNLSIHTLDHQVLLKTSLEVKNELKLVQGLFDLGSQELTLGEDGGRISGENNQNRITASNGGEIVKIAEISNPNGSNPGNLGIEITCRQALGRTEIRRGHLPASLPTGMSVARYFRVLPEHPINEDINFRFYFLDVEKTDREQKHQLWKKSRNRWKAMKTAESSAPSDQFSHWVSGSDFELAQQYIVGPEQQLEETLGSIPSAFTPNADGVNDFFEIPWIQNHPEAQVSIFNRWGDLILRQKEYHRSPWAGKHKGKQLSSSTFFYIIQFRSGKAPLKGKISIVR